MAYRKRTTALKTLTPAAIIPLSFGIDVVSKKIGLDIGQERSYEIAIGLYGLIRGAINWIKHRRRG